MQERVEIDVSKVPEYRMQEICECADAFVRGLLATKEGRKMLREERELYRKEQAERRAAK